MAWIWTLPPDEQISVLAEYDHENSSFESYKVLTNSPLPVTSGTAILRVRRYKLQRVLTFGCLPSTSSAPIVNARFRNLIADQTDNRDVQFYPVQILATDERTDEYCFVIPLRHVPCTDLEKSKITGWTVPGVSAYDYENLRHKEDCLGNLQIARDTVLRHILVSNNLRDALLSTHDKGLAFVEPESMRALPI
jgi:hypothetical protein